MGNTEIRQHKEMAMGKDIGVEGCGTPFKGGNGESGKGKHSKDGARTLKHLSKSADHGPHGMNTPKDYDGD